MKYMEQEQTPVVSISPVEDTKPFKGKTIRLKYIFIIVAVLLVGAVAYFFKGLVIAATVNGTPISRLAVIQEAEKQAGKGALDYLVVTKLIADEVKAKGIAVADEDVQNKVKELETNVSAQGQTLAAFLESQGMTQDQLNEQIVLQQQVEKLVADRVVVNDADIDKYITDNQITFPKDADQAKEKQNIKDYLANQKRSEEIQKYITELREKASINYFVTY